MEVKEQVQKSHLASPLSSSDFDMYDDLDSDLAEIEDGNFNEINLHTGFGYFITAYSGVKLAVTTLLAVLTKNQD